MFTSGPPDHCPATGPLVLRAVVRRAFPEASALATDPGHTGRHQRYLADMLRPYGLVPSGPAGRGQSFGEMAEAVIAEAVPADAPVELLVLAFAGPDLTPGRATATYLSHVCPGSPLALAICDQGSATAFTGLRLIDEYTRSGAARSALLVVVEQADLHHEPAGPVAVPAGHTAVALRFDRAEPGADARLTPLRQRAGVAPEQAGPLLTAELAELAALADGVTELVLSAQLAVAATSLPGGVRTTVADPGRPHTGVWWELATALSTARRIALADYDPQLRYLSVSTLDVGARLPAVAGR